MPGTEISNQGCFDQIEGDIKTVFILLLLAAGITICAGLSGIGLGHSELPAPEKFGLTPKEANDLVATYWVIAKTLANGAFLGTMV